MIREQIMQIVHENPRTVKALAKATGLSKQAVLEHLSVLPVEAVRTVGYGDFVRPIVVIHYVAK